MGVTKVQYACGTIRDAVFKDVQKKIFIAHCPTRCPTCGKMHGNEQFKIL